MNKFGGLQLARHIKMALDIKYGFAKATTTTTTLAAATTTLPS
jgi:hypothetical protein